MNMVAISSYLDKSDFVPFSYLKANFLKSSIDLIGKNDSTILCRTNQMVQQYRNIMAFVYILTHKTNMSHQKQRSKLRGISPGEIQTLDNLTDFFPKIFN